VNKLFIAVAAIHRTGKPGSPLRQARRACLGLPLHFMTVPDKTPAMLYTGPMIQGKIGTNSGGPSRRGWECGARGRPKWVEYREMRRLFSVNEKVGEA